MFKLMDKIETLIDESKSYAEAKYQSVRLESIQKSVEASSSIITWFVIGMVGIISLLLVTLISGLLLSVWLESYIVGFGIVAVIYIVVLVLLLLFGRKVIQGKIQNILYGFFIK